MHAASRIIFVFAVAGAFLLTPRVAAQTPHLSGTVDVDMPRGILSGDVCLSGLAEQDTVHFLLNHALTIASLYDADNDQLAYTGYSRGTMVGEGLLYSTSDSLRDARRLCVRYTGAIPIYNVADSVFNAFDFKGWIAHNGTTLRAAEQSKWYPVPYEPATERLHESMTYELRIRCAECASIYVNGAPPSAGPEIEVAADLPYAPLLFAGDYGFSEIDGTLYLNSDITPEQAAVISSTVEDVKGFYADFLSLPYGDALVFLEHVSVERFHPQRSWGFVTWPTIAFAGSKISRFVSGDSLAGSWVLRFIAHEMGHYYFGTLLQPRGAYRWFLLESIPEYLALKALERFVGVDAYRTMLSGYYEDVVQEPAMPRLDDVTNAETIDNLYRYRYGPLLLVALEREIGEDSMAEFLHALVQAPDAAEMDFQYMRRTAQEIGVPADAWLRFEYECVQKSPEEGCLSDMAQSN